MNTSFLSSLAIAVPLFFVSTIFVMDNHQSLTSLNSLLPLSASAGLFDTLPKKDIFYPLIARVAPKEKNGLRKTCNYFAELLSFCNPSELLLHKDFCASKKDMTSIAFSAIFFDNNHELAESIKNNQKFDLKYKIPGVHAESILVIKDVKIVQLVSEYYEIDYTRQLGHRICNPSSLLMACVSRNPERVQKVIKSAFKSREVYGYSQDLHNYSSLEMVALLYVVISNQDIQTLHIMLQNETMQEHIKKYSHRLLQFILFKQHQYMLKFFIASGCCNLNETGSDEMRYWFGFGNPKADFGCTLLDLIIGYKNVLIIQKNAAKYESIKNILIKNGAKTSQELEEERCVIA